MARRALAFLAIMVCAGAEAEGVLTLNADAYFPEGPRLTRRPRRT